MTTPKPRRWSEMCDDEFYDVVLASDYDALEAEVIELRDLVNLKHFARLIEEREALERKLKWADEQLSNCDHRLGVRVDEVTALEQRLAEVGIDLKHCRAELERVKEVCASINREKNSTFQQSVLNFEQLTVERKVTAVYEAALRFYRNDDLWIGGPDLGHTAREALASAAKLRGES